MSIRKIDFPGWMESAIEAEASRLGLSFADAAKVIFDRALRIPGPPAESDPRQQTLYSAPVRPQSGPSPAPVEAEPAVAPGPTSAPPRPHLGPTSAPSEPHPGLARATPADTVGGRGSSSTPVGSPSHPEEEQVGEGGVEEGFGEEAGNPKPRRKPEALPPIPVDLATAELAAILPEWAAYRKRIGKPMTDRAWTVLWNKLREPAIGRDHAALALEYAIGEGWQGVFPKPDRYSWGDIARLLGKEPRGRARPDPAAPPRPRRRQNTEYTAKFHRAGERILKKRDPALEPLLERVFALGDHPECYPVEELEAAWAEMDRDWPEPPVLIPGTQIYVGGNQDGSPKTAPVRAAAGLAAAAGRLEPVDGELQGGGQRASP